MTPEAIKEQAARLKRACKKTPLLLSAHSKKGVPEALRALADVNRAISQQLDLERLLQQITDAVGQLTGADNAVPWEADSAGRTLTRRAWTTAASVGSLDLPEVLTFEQGGTGWVARHREPLFVEDIAWAAGFVRGADQGPFYLAAFSQGAAFAYRLAARDGVRGPAGDYPERRYGAGTRRPALTADPDDGWRECARRRRCRLSSAAPALVAAVTAPSIPSTGIESGTMPPPDVFDESDAYQRFMGRWSRQLARPLIDFTDIADGGRILDVGSGTGSLAFAVADTKARAQVVGIDPSKEYVAYANSKNRFANRASFQTGDAQQMSFPDASFDASISLLVFNHIPDSLKALREVRRVTKPGGRISAAVWDYGTGMRMLRAFWDSATSLDQAAEKFDQKNMPLCRAGELAELWKKGGLQNVQERPLDITLRFASFADYWDPFLLGQGSAGP